MREDRTAGEAKRKPQAIETGSKAKKPSARAVLTSSPQITADNRGGGWEDARQGRTSPELAPTP